MELHNLFVDFLAIGKLNDVENDQVIYFLEGLQRDNGGRKVSNVGGFQSHNISQGENQHFDMLCGKVLSEVQKISQTMGFAKPFIETCWGNINYKHAYNQAHIHTDSVFSAVYYPRALPYQGEIIFTRDDLTNIFLSQPAVDQTEYNSTHYQHMPQTGELIVFPAWLRHFVRPNETDVSRVSVAFNFNVES